MVAAVILIVAVVFFRVVGAVFGGDSGVSEFLANFSPVAAIFLCGALFMPRRLALISAFGALLVSDIIINARYAGMTEEMTFAAAFLSPHVLVRYFALGLVFALGAWMKHRKKRKLGMVFGATIAASLAFYLITNTASWIAEPAYAKSLAGWWQALTTGLPGWPPTWTFFRNSLAGDLFFTSLFLIAVQPYARLRPELPESASALSAPSRP